MNLYYIQGPLLFVLFLLYFIRFFQLSRLTRRDWTARWWLRSNSSRRNAGEQELTKLSSSPDNHKSLHNMIYYPGSSNRRKATANIVNCHHQWWLWIVIISDDNDLTLTTMNHCTTSHTILGHHTEEQELSTFGGFLTMVVSLSLSPTLSWWFHDFYCNPPHCHGACRGLHYNHPHYHGAFHDS